MKQSEKLTTFLGIVLLTCAAFFLISLMVQFLDFGAQSFGHKTIFFGLGRMLYTVYGFSAFLIPVYLLAAALLLFMPNWTMRKGVYLAISILPFFTLVVAERAAKALFSGDSGLLLAVKICASLVIAALIVAIEYLVAGILSDAFEGKYSSNNQKKDIPAKSENPNVESIPENRTIANDTKIPETKTIESEISIPEAKTIESEISIPETTAFESETSSPEAKTIESNISIPETANINNNINSTVEVQPVDSDNLNYMDKETSSDVSATDIQTVTGFAKNIPEELPVVVDSSTPKDPHLRKEELDALLAPYPTEEALPDEIQHNNDDSTEESFPDEAQIVNDASEQDEEQQEQLEAVSERILAPEAEKPIPIVLSVPDLIVEDIDDDETDDDVDEKGQLIDSKNPNGLIAENQDIDTDSDIYDDIIETPQINDDLYSKNEESFLDNPFDEDPDKELEEENLEEEDIIDNNEEKENSIESIENSNNDIEQDESTIISNIPRTAGENPLIDIDEDNSLDDIIDDTANETVDSDEQIEENETINSDESVEENTNAPVDSEEPAVTNTVADGHLEGNTDNLVSEQSLDSNPDNTNKETTVNSSSSQNQQANTIPLAVPSRKRGEPYSVPADLLTSYPDGEYWIIDKATQRASSILKETLSEFKIQAEVTGIRKGPVITMFEILPAPGVKLNKIVALQDNIALRLAASSVRIVAPIPGKSAVGIEVPNKERAIVSFKELIETDSPAYKKMSIPVVLGKDITGEAQLLDLAKTPHLLIAGSTGSGKSVCVNSMILSILYKRSPQEVRLILIDPKVVELKLYNDIPHLLTPVITEPKKAFQALQYCLCEMERRYALLDGMGVREINSYNRRIVERDIATEKLPYIVVVIDEFADLMATTGKELESTVARLAAMSRAVGIHLVLATQRPSIDVITGLIKANIPTRIAFMVASKMDSRIIIDQVGAEKLLGRGDMLYASATDPFPVRIQGTFVSDNEVENVVDYVKQYGEPEYIDEEIFVDDEEDESTEQSLFSENGEDPLYEKALDIVVQAGKASASYIQRRLKIGYNRAARLVEEMEDRGIVGPANGSKPREIIHIP